MEKIARYMFALQLTFYILLRLGILSLHSQQIQFIKYSQRKRKKLSQGSLEIWIKNFQKTHIGNITARRVIKEEISLIKMLLMPMHT